MKNIYKNISILALAFCSVSTMAQVKIGANPTIVATNAKLDVEGTTGARTVVLDNGNVGVGTTAPTTQLHILNAGTATGVFNAATSNMGLRLENATNGKSIIQHFLTKDAVGGTKETIMGVNPTYNSGNGVFLISRTGTNDVVLDLANGRVGIGQGIPNTRLHATGALTLNIEGVAGTTTPTTTFNDILHVTGGSWGFGDKSRVLSWSYNMAGTPGGDALHLFVPANVRAGADYTDATINIYTDNTNNNWVGIGTINPTYTLTVNGSVAGTSAYNNTSDARLKKNVRNLDNALSKIMSLRGVTFNWDLEKAQEFDKKGLDTKEHIGFLAQEIEQILPQVVTKETNKNEVRSVAYGDVVPVLVEAIKQQQAQIDALKAERTTYKTGLEELKAEMASLKAVLGDKKDKQLNSEK